MKRLMTICAVVGLMLSTTCVSWAVIVNSDPMVNSPPGAPEWWNVECIYYAYGWWEEDIIPDSTDISPPDDVTHWSSNFLSNTDFKASAVCTRVVSIDLCNVYREDLYKEIYIYLEGTTTSTEDPTLSNLDTDGGTFTGSWGGSVGSGLWFFAVEGEIDPQPEYVKLTVTVPGLTSVTNIWAGENCVPEPATLALLGLGVLRLVRMKRTA